MQLRLENVGRIYSWDWAIQNVSAEFTSGETVCLLGANGSGKSTLLRLISGMIRPTSGQVWFDGRRVRRGAISVAKRMLLLEPDQRIIGGRLTSHFATVMAGYGGTESGIEQTISKWLQHFDLLEYVSTEPVKLSRGQQFKVWLATLFTLRPSIWLLDEPHQSGLDAHGIETLEEEIGKHQSEGGLTVFTSQYPPHARRLATRSIVLERSRVVYDGDIDGMNAAATESSQFQAIVRSLESSTL